MPIFQDNRELLARLNWLRILFVLTFLLLLSKLWSIAVLEFQHFRDLAERNRVRTYALLAPRGLIRDREGRVLVDNVYKFNLLLFRDEIQELPKTLDFLAEGLNMPSGVLRERLRAAEDYSIYEPVVLKESLSMEETAYLLARQSEHPELRIVKQPRRIHRYGRLAAHVLGYGGEVSQEQLENPEFSDSKPGNIVGQYGVERIYNQRLRGSDGRRSIMVDSRGKLLQELQLIDPIQGNELTLTLDLDLQMVAETELGDSPGAVVAFDARTGEILAMASGPSFDPNQFEARLTAREWKKLLDNPDDPLQNRAVQNTFSPGSIFKIVIGLAGLENGVINVQTETYCNGAVQLYGNRFRCWNAAGHGRVTLREAIRQSCNVYFYLLGQKLGIQAITEFSQRVGLGFPTGIELRGEASGLVPSKEWKRRVRGAPWYAGETISVAIGQGPLLATPIQLARAMGIIATGARPDLRLVRERKELPVPQSKVSPTTVFSEDHLQVIREAMWSVVNEGGTGWAAKVADFQVCGKTGTAQSISSATRRGLSEQAAKRFEPNAWFVGFAPRDDPQVVVAVIVQRGGAGGTGAAPIAQAVFKLYYEKYQKGHFSPLEMAEGSKLGKRL